MVEETITKETTYLGKNCFNIGMKWWINRLWIKTTAGNSNLNIFGEKSKQQQSGFWVNFTTIKSGAIGLEAENTSCTATDAGQPEVTPYPF